MKLVYLLFGVLLLGSLSFAMGNATATKVTERGRWLGLAGTNVTTEGGNITAVNLTGATLTDRWAAFYGNVSGNIRLTDSVGTNNVYNWSWSPTSGGSVCFSEGGAFVWGSAVAATGAGVDTAYTLGTASDNAANTLTDAADCSLNFTQAYVATSAKVTHEGLSNFWTCAIKDSGSAKADFAFCTNISNAGTNWNGESANFEVMVPTTPSISGTEDYFAYAQLN